MQRARSDPYTSWLLGLTLIVFLLGAASTLFVGSPWFQDAYALPRARLVLETAMAIAAAAVAVLAGTRFAVEGRRVDLLLCSGFAVAALGGFAFDVAPSLSERGPGAPEAWSALLARVLAAALVAAAAFARGRIVDRRRAIAATAGAVVAALAIDWLFLRLQGGGLPLVDPGDGTRPAVLTITVALLALLALLAAIGFGLRYRRERKDLDSWLTLAATLTLFADLHYVLTPSLSGEYLLHGDFLRVLAYGTLLVGVWRGIRAAEFGRAVAEERARVAREIHDGLAQYLFALSTHASMLEAGAPLDEVLPKLTRAAAQAQQEARFAVLALSSASGTAPFDAALRRYVEFLTADGELAVDVEIEPEVSLAPDEQIEVFRIVQESLANVRRHAGASRADVLIGARGGRRIVRVRDDGVGFDGAEAPAGQGLRNMRRRAESIEGGFSLRSLPGRGTALEVVLRA